jgi:hypothetical protein
MLGNVVFALTLAVGQVPADSGPSLLQASGVNLLAPLEMAPSLPTAASQPAPPEPAPKKGPTPVPVTPEAKKDKENDKDKSEKDDKAKEPPSPYFLVRFLKAYKDEFKRKGAVDENPNPPERRGLPEPWSAPPFPGHEYQGYPLIGIPKSGDVYPLMKAIYDGKWGDDIKDCGIKCFGWFTSGGNWSNARNALTPTSYWIQPNHYYLDQAVLRFEREADTVQTDHIDWAFRCTAFYGIDYRYTTAGGWWSDQLLKNNRLYGLDPIEQYFDVYIPWVMEGLVFRLGRWVACPDIETQLAPDNYLASHSLLFTYDTYTQTGFFFTLRPQEQWLLQAGLNAGNDMAPWYKGAIPSGFFGVRWVSKENNDAFYTCLNQINNAQFRHFTVDGQAAGHDNFNYIVSTWEHRFNKNFHTKTESYYMWEFNAVVGGTPSIGPPQSFGGGGGSGAPIPGLSQAYGVLNYTMYAFTKRDYATVRNEWWKDETGFRAGFRGTYTSHTIGWSHQFNDLVMIRPEIGYYRNWHEPAFDLGTKKGIWIYGFDFTVRF